MHSAAAMGFTAFLFLAGQLTAFSFAIPAARVRVPLTIRGGGIRATVTVATTATARHRPPPTPPPPPPPPPPLHLQRHAPPPRAIAVTAFSPPQPPTIADHHRRHHRRPLPTVARPNRRTRIPSAGADFISDVPMGPADPILGLNEDFKKDTDPGKVC